jgi:hypothetical protein
MNGNPKYMTSTSRIPKTLKRTPSSSTRRARPSSISPWSKPGSWPLGSPRSHQGTTATSAWPPDLVEQEKGEDYYVITLSFRPEGDFVGEPGR